MCDVSNGTFSIDEGKDSPLAKRPEMKVLWLVHHETLRYPERIGYKRNKLHFVSLVVVSRNFETSVVTETVSLICESGMARAYASFSKLVDMPVGKEG